jgi:segregation and condensation protein A
MSDPTLFEAVEPEDALVLDLAGYEGPLHLLLELARAQKVDLAKISVAALADQYLAFVSEMRATRMDLASEYLVMAAWLTFLKSKLLLPKPKVEEDEPDAEAMEAHLRKRLEHLAQARAAAERLWVRPQLDRDVFLFGAPQPVAITRETVWRDDIYDLMAAYGAHWTRKLAHRAHNIRPRRAYPLEAARKRLESLLERQLEEWRPIEALTPKPEGDMPPPRASYIASLLGAALELSREGHLDLRQHEPFAPLYLKKHTA